MKYYAIKSGYKTGVFYDTWDNVKQYVEKYPKAIYKGFDDQKSADDYMAIEKEGKNDNDIVTNELVKKEIENLAPDKVIAFVDGSYKNNLENKHPEKYGYGAVILTKSEGEVLKNYLYNSSFDTEGLTLKNVAGELLATEETIKWVVKMEKFNKVHIYYDYEGIEKWINGEWKARKKITQDYVDFIKAQSIKIEFTKVKAHNGIEYNETADKLAKNSLEGATYKTHKDGSVYIKGLLDSKWENIVDSVKSELKEQVSISNNKKNGNRQIVFKAGNDNVTVTVYNGTGAYIQGSSSSLFNEVFEIAISELDSDEDAIINLNHYHDLKITSSEVDIEYRRKLPKASIKENDSKVVNTLKNAVYNTMLTGYKPDYTDLVSPINRIMEHYLHAMFEYAGIDTERVKLKGNAEVKSYSTFLNYFRLNDEDEFILDPSKKELGKREEKPIRDKINTLTSDQKELIEKIYNWYHSNRNETFHWSQESEDTTLISSMTEARDKINEGEKLIESFYEIF